MLLTHQKTGLRAIQSLYLQIESGLVERKVHMHRESQKWLDEQKDAEALHQSS